MNDKYIRREQDSNLRGETPLDFESNVFKTTRPSQRLLQKVIARTVVREFHLANEPDISNIPFFENRTERSFNSNIVKSVFLYGCRDIDYDGEAKPLALNPKTEKNSALGVFWPRMRSNIYNAKGRGTS